jgi:hypothetical protein
LVTGACGKVEPKTGSEPDASGASDVRTDPTLTDAGRGDAYLDARSTTDSAADAAADIARDASDSGPPLSDGSMPDRTIAPDAEQDAPRIVDAPAGDAPGDGSKRCVLGQAKVGDCTL